tara:strand:- start:969 stop:1271 length:303 start_codon:yes stop_codon:yes gene_type:complete
MTLEERLLKKINEHKNMYDIYHAIKHLWIDMDETIARAVWYTADFDEAQRIVENVMEDMEIEEAIFEVVGYDWFQQHCSNTDYLDEKICNELLEFEIKLA